MLIAFTLKRPTEKIMAQKIEVKMTKRTCCLVFLDHSVTTDPYLTKLLQFRLLMSYKKLNFYALNIKKYIVNSFFDSFT
jgi:hypothetical protein